MRTLHRGAGRSPRNDDRVCFAQDAFTLEKRAPSRTADRYGDVPRGAVIRTDERYNQNDLFQGPRGWDYWNLLEIPSPIRTRSSGPTSGRRTFSASW